MTDLWAKSAAPTCEQIKTKSAVFRYFNVIFCLTLNYLKQKHHLRTRNKVIVLKRSQSPSRDKNWSHQPLLRQYLIVQLGLFQRKHTVYRQQQRGFPRKRSGKTIGIRRYFDECETSDKETHFPISRTVDFETGTLALSHRVCWSIAERSLESKTICFFFFTPKHWKLDENWTLFQNVSHLCTVSSSQVAFVTP